MTAHATSPSLDAHLSSGGRLVALDGRTLALEGTGIRAEASGGFARVVLEQRFRNVHADPLRALYQVPLPQDAAVSGYAFRIGERRVVGEVDRKRKARERFEEALIEGRTAGLFEQDRSSLFSQEIGNIPPGALIVAEIVIDQRLRWLDEGAWEWRFPMVVAPRYLGTAGDTPDAERVSVDVADPTGTPLAARAQLRLEIGDVLAEGGAPSSPSHTLSTAAESVTARHVLSFAEGSARLDRDVVVCWPVAAAHAGVSIVTGRRASGRGAGDDCAFGLLTLVPPRSDSRGESLPRDLIVLLDTSGSMSGEPLEQAKRVVRALIERLDDADRLELIEFSTQPRRWKRGAVSATARARAQAIAWVDRLQASGGTEMVSGILEALRATREGAQRQLILVTDGLVGFEERVIEEILRSQPQSTRVHTVGIGSSVNRSLTAAAARAGRGVEVLIGLGEDAAPAIERLLARTSQPLVTDLEISGPALLEHAPSALPDLFGGAPVLVALKLRPEGGGLVVRGHRCDGAWEECLAVPAIEAGSGCAAVAPLYARERVEDLETMAATGKGVAVDAEIECLGLSFQIATRLTSWVAISQEPTVDAGQPTLRERIPHELAHGISAEGLGLTRAFGFPDIEGMSPQEHTLNTSPAESTRKVLATLSAREEQVLMMRFGIRKRADAADEGSFGDFEDTRDSIRELEKSALRKLRHPSRSRIARDPFDEEPASLESREVRLVGRIVVRSDAKLVVEIELLEPLTWKPDASASLLLSSGLALEAVVDGEHSTVSGRHARGQTLRLTLEAGHDIPADEPREILLESGGTRLRIAIET